MRQLQDYQPFLSALLRSMVNELEFDEVDSLKDCLRNPRLVTVMNHSTPLSWIPPICWLTEKVCEAGGGARYPRGVVDRFFYGNPLTRPIAEYVSQSDHPQSFEDILESFQHADQTDLVVFPEGALTFFGDVNKIQKFRSPRFLEIAIRAKAPLLLAVHRGSESWNMPLTLPFELVNLVGTYSKFFGEKLKEEQTINLPLRLSKIPRFAMKTKLYVPELYEADLSADPHERRAQLEVETEKLRQIMQDLFDEIQL